MSLSRPFILRPIATSLLMVAILLVGIVAYHYLPISALPEADYPTIQIQTFYPGASPEVMTSSVTAPLERQLGQMPGLQEMISTSSGGASTITLQFVLSLNLDVAEQEVQAAINAATTFLPPDLPAPPVYAKVNPADAPILTLAASSKSLPLAQIEDLAESRLAQKIAQLPGVGLVSIGGGQRPAVRIQVNPRALAAYGLSLEDVRNAVGAANVNIPKGNLDGLSRAFAIGANDQIKSAAGYRDLVIAYRSGAAVQLSDVAQISDGVENRYLAAWRDREPAVILDVRRQPGTNVIQVVDSIRTLLPELQAGLPPAVDVTVLTDRTNTIRASVRDVELELLLSALLVVLVIYAFLRDLPATLIPSLSVPLSLVGTFSVMYLAGFSLNNLSLMALTIATGFVVDDAIVMIENIARHIEQGVPPRQAALKGAQEIGFTILSLTVSLIAVLIPLLFMGDVVGRLFREFAITLAVTIVISALVSLTLVPMLCARLMRPHAQRGQAAWQRRMDAWFQRVIDVYDRTLRWVLDHSTATLFVAAGTLLLTGVLYFIIPKGFFPIQDTGLIQAVTEAPQTISFRAMTERQQSLVEALLRDPDVASLSSFVGIDGVNATVNNGRLLINLRPKEERQASAQEIIQRLRSVAGTVRGISLYMQPVQDLTLDAHVGSTQFQFSLEDASAEELAIWTKRLLEQLARAPQLTDVVSDAQNDGLAVAIDIDRATAGRYGITPAAIDNALYDAFGQRIVSTIMTQSNQYRVILEADPQVHLRPQSLSTIYVPAANGTQVPLSAVVRATQRTVPLRIDHLGQFPVNHISFNLGAGRSLGEAVAAIRQAEDEIGLPKSVVASFQGAAQAFQASLSNELLLILAAVVAVYIVLGVLYESYVHPVTILSTLPSAGVGALLALLIVGSDLGVIGIIGIVLLIGIVKKNAIMMVDFAIEARRDGHVTARQAIHQACLLRFRPILMTTLAALLGALPLMLGTGTGSELRFPLGVSIAGGLVVSQLLTLFTTPVIYLAFDQLSQRFAGRRQHQDEEEEPGEAVRLNL